METGEILVTLFISLSSVLLGVLIGICILICNKKESKYDLNTMKIKRTSRE
jgi:ABC-type amino acid transport system permease subunit